MSEPSPSSVLYHVDANNVLTWVNPEWWAFAQRNDAPEMEPSKVLGKCLWDFIDDETTLRLYQLMTMKVQTEGATVRVPLRCDSPDRRRLIELVLSPLPEQGVCYSAITLREQPRSSVELLDRAGKRDLRFIRMCGWCKRIPMKGEWLELEVAVERMGLMKQSTLPKITHGICPRCLDVAMRKVRKDEP